jgi:hypothetical protein
MWHDLEVTSRPAAAQRLRGLARLRRVRDRIDREYAQPLDVGPADQPGTSISGLPVRL